jgi:uncharacterized integral membrane protein (TIGR00698 family)
LILVGALAGIGVAAAHWRWTQDVGLSALTLTIVLGIVAGNTFFPSIATRTAAGVDFSRTWLLRAGVILYGFQITFQQIASVGVAGVVIAALMLSLTFLLAVQLGMRLFKLDTQTSMLIGAGSAICGAAAVIAAEPVVGGQAHKVSVAVATVVIFGTLGMFIYPLLYPHLGLSPHRYGIFAGSTIHEVAQVLVAGKSVSGEAASSAVIEKMLRVMMLAPFLLVLSGCRSFPNAGGARSPRIVIPWFAVLFIAASAVNSLHVVPEVVGRGLIQLDTVLLSMAMAALGLRTHVGAARQAGLKPLILAASLFAFLLIGGYAINCLVMHMLS